MAVPLSKSLSYVLDWLLPPVCPATGQDVDVHGTVAADYWASLRFIRAPFCRQCAMPFAHEIGGDNPVCAACLDHPPAFREGRCALIYDDASRKLILRFKHGDQLQAVRTLVPWLKDAGGEMLAGADVLIPVPLHRWRLLKRRYNQSALMARGLSKAAGKPVLMQALRRVRATPPQGALKRAERLDNVKNAFVVTDAAAVCGKAVVLVDDVFTTGATLDACARALLGAGAKSVDVLAVARVVKDM